MDVKGSQKRTVQSTGHLYLKHDPIPDLFSPLYFNATQQAIYGGKNTHKEDLFVTTKRGKWVSGSNMKNLLNNPDLYSYSVYWA